jgi:hypothetical protein
MNCKCGNEARYINERGEMCCGICPIREGIISTKLVSGFASAGTLVIKNVEQLLTDQTYETYVPTSDDGDIIGEPLAYRLKQVENAKSEAKLVARLLGLVRGRASGHGDIDIEEAEAVGTTVVYERDGKTFHLVVHDMTDFKP